MASLVICQLGNLYFDFVLAPLKGKFVILELGLENGERNSDIHCIEPKNHLLEYKIVPALDQRLHELGFLHFLLF